MGVMEPRGDETDSELVRRAQGGERGAFDCLAARYRGMARAMAFLRTRDDEAAEDLAQEALAKAWEKLPSLQEPGAFRGWLQVIVINACRNWSRGRQWPESLDDLPEPPPDPAPGPLDGLLARERRELWRKALLALPEANRLPLIMHVRGGQSYEEIARQLDVPVSTIEGRIHRARLQLRRLLRNDAAELLGEPRRHWQGEGNTP
ncbi:MAG: RNA polymerase sigma factor [Armatimonadota bacterium]